MKKMMIVVLTLVASQHLLAQDFNKSMAEIMRSMKIYTIEMVDLMPQEKFDFRPVDSVRTFKAQVRHIIATNHLFYHHFLLNNGKGDLDAQAERSFAYANQPLKKDLMRLLGEQFDQLITFYEQASSKQYKKTYMLIAPDNSLVKRDYYTLSMLIRDHIADHRSQLIVYLRLNDIKPAAYRGI
jgi:uncharacterized damage-inducible protein DinB